jgi:hypothetical protein
MTNDEDGDEDDDEDGPANGLPRFCASRHPFPSLQELSLNRVTAPVEAFRLFMSVFPLHTLRTLVTARRLGSIRLKGEQDL